MLTCVTYIALLQLTQPQTDKNLYEKGVTVDLTEQTGRVHPMLV